MNRSQKESLVKSFADEVEKSQAFALLSFSKVTVEQMTEFRKSLSSKNIRAKVLKNTLARRVFEGTPYKAVTESLTGPTMVAYGPDDPIVTAKAIWEWAEKEEFNVSVKNGAALGQVMSEAELKALSKLPGRDELFVSFLWALKSHPTRFLNALQDAPRKLGYALGALKDKKEKES